MNVQDTIARSGANQRRQHREVQLWDIALREVPIKQLVERPLKPIARIITSKFIETVSFTTKNLKAFGHCDDSIIMKRIIKFLQSDGFVNGLLPLALPGMALLVLLVLLFIRR